MTRFIPSCLQAALPMTQTGLESFLEENKSKQQLKLDAIQARLSREVMANYQSFVDGMRQLSEIDMDVSRASIHVSNSLRKMGNAKESLVSGTLGITYRRRRRERLAMAKHRAEWLRSIVSVADAVDKACNDNRFSEAVKIVTDAQSKLSDPTARSYAVVGAMKSRVDGALDSVCDRIDRSLEQQLVKFDPAVYAAIVQAYRDLDDHGVKARAYRRAKQAADASAAGGSGAGGVGGGRRDRSGTLDVEGSSTLGGGLAGLGSAGDDLSGGLSGFGTMDGGGSSLLASAGAGIGGGAAPGQSLLQEVGSSIAVAASAAAGGITSVRGLGPADGNIASLPHALQRAATSAVKTISKDIVIDLLLKELRAKINENSKNGADNAGYGDEQLDEEDADAGDDADADADDLLRSMEKNLQLPADDGKKSRSRSNSAAAGAAKKSSLPPEVEYNQKRNDMRGLPFSQLCAMIKADDVPQASMAVAACILHVMHQHFLALQWHRAPFDPRNNFEGQEFLHRCGIDDETPASDNEASDGGGASMKRQSAAQVAFTNVLRDIRPYLLKARSGAWGGMQQRYSALLFAAVNAEGLNLPVERLAQILVLSRDLMTVGLEFVGHGRRNPSNGELVSAELDPSNTLRGSLRLLCSQYMDTIHGECFNKLRGMLSNELWQPVPMNEQSFTTLMDNAASGIKSKFSKAATAAVQAATAAIIGSDLMDGSNNSNGGSGADNDGEGGPGAYKTYSDGASFLCSWLDRGNPFGHVQLCRDLLPTSSSASAGDGSTSAVGSTVLPTPRPPVPQYDDESDEDSDDEDEDEATRKDPAFIARRAQAKLMRQVHGDGYHLDVALGRGPSLGFSLLLAGGEAPTAVMLGKSRTAADSDDDSDSDASEEVVDDGTSGSSDEDDEDDRRGRRVKRSEDADHAGFSSAAGGGAGASSSGVTGPYAAIFGGAHHHTVTAAALNGFAKAVGRYVLLMEVLPTVASDAFTGLARLFELYLYTVSTLFLRPPVIRQLYDVATPSPHPPEHGRDQHQFEYCDGTSFHVAARVAAAACEARDADHGRAGPGASSSAGGAGSNKQLRRAGSANYGGAGSLDRSFTSDGAGGNDAGVPASARKGGRNAKNDDESVVLYGVQVVTRGLSALAQAQNLPLDFYSPIGQGAAAGSVLGGHVWNSDGIFITLRRALQQIGADLSTGARGMGTGSTSVLSDGHFQSDTGVSTRGFSPEPYVRLQSTVQIEGEQSTFGIVERCVAAESLEFLIDVMARVRGRIETHLSASHSASINNFYHRAVLCVCQLRGLMYHSFIPRLLPESGAIPNMIMNVKW